MINICAPDTAPLIVVITLEPGFIVTGFEVVGLFSFFYMKKFLVSFLLVWFVLFLIYWFKMLFTKPENMGYIAFMFFSHIILVAVYLNKFIEEVIKK